MLRSRILWELFAGYVVLILLSTAIVGVLVSKQVEEETARQVEEEHHTQIEEEISKQLQVQQQKCRFSVKETL